LVPESLAQQLIPKQLIKQNFYNTMPSIKTITSGELDALCKNGTPIDEKGGYPAVILHPDDTITKIWARPKSLFSSSTLRPYSNRFVNNATKLAQRGIHVPQIINHAKLENSFVRIVTYHALLGSSIRELLHNTPHKVNIPDLCRFFLELHDKGINYRTIHLGNIIQLSNQNGFGLIDFTDVSFASSPLSLKRRATNIAIPHRRRYQADIQAHQDAGLPDIITTYIDLLSLTEQQKSTFLAIIHKLQK
jgi:hypothetical protein